jgi:hypothetical protein
MAINRLSEENEKAVMEADRRHAELESVIKNPRPKG